MFPTIFKIGQFAVPSYGLMLLFATLVSYAIVLRRAPKFGFPKEHVIDLATGSLLSGVLGARLAFVVQDWGYYSKHLNEIITFRMQGLTSFGGLAFGVLFAIVWARWKKIPLATLFDTAGPSVLIGWAIGRVGCLLNGCCYGGQCQLPWGIPVYNENGHALPGLFHPAQLYDSLFNVAGYIGILLLERRGLRPWGAFGWMLVFHGLARFIYEFWRIGTTSTSTAGLPITDAQIAALVVVLVGLPFVLRRAPATFPNGSEA